MDSDPQSYLASMDDSVHADCRAREENLTEANRQWAEAVRDWAGKQTHSHRYCACAEGGGCLAACTWSDCQLLSLLVSAPDAPSALRQLAEAKAEIAEDAAELDAITQTLHDERNRVEDARREVADGQALLTLARDEVARLKWDYQKAQKEVKRLAENLSVMVNRAAAAEAQLAAKDAEIERLRAALEGIEWSGKWAAAPYTMGGPTPYYLPACPICKGIHPDANWKNEINASAVATAVGHKPNCIFAALAETATPEHTTCVPDYQNGVCSVCGLPAGEPS